jgi:hypothetical protein
MRRALPLIVVVAGIAAAGCSSGQGTGHLVGLPASEAICRVAKDGLSYRMGSGPVVKPTEAIACRRVDGPQPHVIGAKRLKQLVVIRATCPATVGCV